MFAHTMKKSSQIDFWILHENKNDLVYIADVIKKHFIADVIETFSSGKTIHFFTNFDTKACMFARKTKLIMKNF
jgi:hypothetical protein